MRRFRVHAALDAPAMGANPGFPGAFANIPNCRNNLFCAGHSALADGRIFLAGSHWAYAHPIYAFADLFNPANSVWNNPPPPDMYQGRWYPTCTTLGDGTVLVTSGLYGPPQGTLVTIPELYNPATNSWTRLTSADRQQALYPYMFLLPDGNLVDAGPGAARMLKSSNWTWAGTLPEPGWPNDPPPLPPGWDGSAAMYAARS